VIHMDKSAHCCVCVCVCVSGLLLNYLLHRNLAWWVMSILSGSGLKVKVIDQSLQLREEQCCLTGQCNLELRLCSSCVISLFSVISVF